MGTPKPLARSSAMFDTESTEDEVTMCIYKEERKDAKKENRGTAGKKGKTLTMNRQYEEQ